MKPVARLWRLAPLVGASWFGLLGCAAGGDGLSADLDRLRSEVASLKSQNAAFAERLGAVESASRAPIQPHTEAAIAPATPSRPKLEVVRLTPSEPDPLDASVETPALAPQAAVAAPPAPRVRYRTTSKGIVEELVPLDEASQPRPASGSIVAQAKPSYGPTSANRSSASPAGRSQ